jgi:hypothetical protein
MPTLGFIVVKPNLCHAIKVPDYGGTSQMFNGENAFREARAFVEGAVVGKAKMRDATRAGVQGGVGGPRTYEVYT